jgi:diguanylate cyclase (GGDEF)-like protein
VPPEHGASACPAIGALRSSSLLARFGVVSLVVVTVLGFVLSHQLERLVSARAQANAEQSAQVLLQLVKGTIIGPPAGGPPGPSGGVPGEPDGTADPAQVNLSRRLVEDPIIGEQVLGADVWLPDGTLAYSTKAAAIGAREELSPQARAALEGRTVSRVTDASAVRSDVYDPATHSGEQVLVIDMPLSVDDDDEPEVAVEIALAYASTAAGVRHDTAVMVGWLAGGLLTLYLLLFRLMATASRRLRTQAAVNRDLALHDALTGLPNRSLLQDRVEQALAQARRHGTQTALLLLDLDRFKEVNDTLGHHHGDRLLMLVGPRLAGALREQDTVARLGGDEFVVLLPEVSGEAGARTVAATLVAALAEPFVVDDMELDVGCSLGIAVGPDHGEDFDTLLRHADVAMYASKATQAGVTVYDAQHDAHSPARLAMLGELRRAIDTGRLVLHYQPKADIRTGAVIGVEALVRWPHPHRGLLGPDTFIPLAERAGLIRSLTLVVLDQALEQAARWARDGRPMSVAVNVSARCLLDLELDQEVAAALARHGVPGDRLELEIAESSVLVDPDRALGVLRALAGLGVRLSIDDFGTGYSSMAYLKRMPVHELKIDRSFVSEITDGANEVIVSASIDLARRLGLAVIAEGVEDQATWDRLAELGCNAAQGFLLSRPVPAAELDAWLADRVVAGA